VKAMYISLVQSQRKLGGCSLQVGYLTSDVTQRIHPLPTIFIRKNGKQVWYDLCACSQSCFPAGFSHDMLKALLHKPWGSGA
jgi:hypothetical protein